jgi:prepilin-type N-terminal cleavage/methylation domain-containing protein
MIRARGFTLIEMAIVLVIITILIGGLAVPLAAQIQARRIAETNKTLEEAKEALIGYAMTHKVMVDHDSNPATPTIARPYLPCPSNGNGVEGNRVGGFCTQNVGWLPWVTLGTAAQDSWGNRLEYASQPGVTRTDTGFHNATLTPATEWHVVCSSETPAICTINPNVGDIAVQVPVVVLSRGANGWGGRNVNGNTLAAPTGAHELSNSDGDESYVSRPPSKPDEAAGEFDDLVTWLSFNLLITRVCPAGGCP